MGEKITFCKGGGCTAKLGAGILSRVLERLPKGKQDPNLLIGYDSKDDAAVYQSVMILLSYRHWIFFHRWRKIHIHLVKLRQPMP